MLRLLGAITGCNGGNSGGSYRRHILAVREDHPLAECNENRGSHMLSWRSILHESKNPRAWNPWERGHSQLGFGKGLSLW